MKYCPICKRYYEPKKGAENMVVDCPYCWEGQTMGVTEPDDWMMPITKCTQCGTDIHAGGYGAHWGMCPKCAKKNKEATEMADEEIRYEQTVNTMVVMAECLNKLAQRIEYTGDITMNSYRDRAIEELAAGVHSASLAVKTEMEKIGCLRKERDKLNEDLESVRNMIRTNANGIFLVMKERDELKAQLAKCEHCHSADEFCELQERLAAAERCIEDISNVMCDGVIADCAEGMKVNDIIRAYREKKEEVK